MQSILRSLARGTCSVNDFQVLLVPYMQIKEQQRQWQQKRSKSVGKKIY